MKLKDFISSVSALLPDESDAATIKNIVDLESALIVEEIKNILNQPEYQSVEAKTRLDSKNITPFLEVIRKHAETIALTNALPQYSPNTLANKLVKELVKMIRGANLAKNESQTTLLYPKISKANSKVKVGKRSYEIASIAEQSFVWEDSGKNIIQVAECLRRVDPGVRDEANELCLFRTSDQTKTLSKLERERVINHSEATIKFYNACKEAVNNNNATKQVMDGFKNTLREDLANSSNKVNLGYGKAGDDLLAERLYQNINSVNDLILDIARRDRSLWGAYVAHIPAGKAKSLLGQVEKEIAGLISNQTTMSPRVALFVAYGLYSRDRGLQPNVKPDYPGLRFIAPLMQYTGKQKTGAAGAVMRLLADERFDLASIATLLDKDVTDTTIEQIKQIDAVSVENVCKERGALLNGELGGITKALVGAYKPEQINEQEVKPAKMR